jgi:hypothetical protein
MSDLRRKAQPAWVAGLTPDEVLEINLIEKECAAIDEERKALTRRRCLIQQRANQRVLSRQRREHNEMPERDNG